MPETAVLCCILLLAYYGMRSFSEKWPPNETNPTSKKLTHETRYFENPNQYRSVCDHVREVTTTTFSK